MNTPPTPDDLNEELMTRWIDGHLTPDELAAMQRAVLAEPMLAREKESADRLGSLLRQHLPSTLDPPSPDFFTSRIMEEIHGVPVLKTMAPAAVRPSGVFSWLKQPWFAPLASAAAVALLFLASNGSRSGTAATSVAQAYAPDPRVTATAYFSAEAEATVIDLKGLDAVPDDREIRAYDVADAQPVMPGRPLVLHAANQPDRAILVLAPDTAGYPRFRELN